MQPVSMQRLGKQIPASADARNNTDAGFSVLWSVPRGYKKDKENRLRQ
jgi:hypothetical protein